MWTLIPILAAVALADEPGPIELDPDASARFEEALQQLADGQLEAGCEQLRRVAVGSPDDPTARWSEDVARTINGLQPRRCQWAGSDRDTSTDGRAELIISQGTVWPIWAGAGLPIWGADVSAPAVGLAVIGGLGVGIGGTYAITNQVDVTTAQAMMVYSGELLGTWYGAWLEIALADQPTARPAHLGFVGGGLLGVAAAAGFDDASAGDVALARMGAIWGTGFGGVAAPWIDQPGARGTFAALGTGTTLGLVTTGLLATQIDLRRGQVNAINLGGYAGALTGGALILIAQPDDARVATGIVGAGMVAGLTTAAILVARNDGDGGVALRYDADAYVTMLPGPDGRVRPRVGFTARF